MVHGGDDCIVWRACCNLLLMSLSLDSARAHVDALLPFLKARTGHMIQRSLGIVLRLTHYFRSDLSRQLLRR